DRIKSDHQVVCIDGDMLHWRGVRCKFAYRFSSPGMFTDSLTDVVRGTCLRYDIPVCLKQAGQFPIDGLAWPDSKELPRRGVFPQNSRPRSEDIVDLFNECDFQRARS